MVISGELLQQLVVLVTAGAGAVATVLVGSKKAGKQASDKIGERIDRHDEVDRRELRALFVMVSDAIHGLEEVRDELSTQASTDQTLCNRLTELDGLVRDVLDGLKAAHPEIERDELSDGV